MKEEDLTQHNFDKLKQRLNAANQEIVKLNEEKKVNLHIIGVLEERNKQLIQGKLTADQIVQLEIQRMNEVSNGYLEENEELKKRINELINSD